jgi:signal transduction histidine kinase
LAGTARAGGIVLAFRYRNSRGDMNPAELGMSLNRSIVAALLELASADRADWPSTIQHILRVDARALEVERVSYWRMREEPPGILCEMAYQRATGAFERGHIMAASEHAAYFDAIRTGPIRMVDATTDPRASSMREYLDARGIGAMLDFPVWVRGVIAGVVCHEHVGAPRPWSGSDEHFAATVAQVIASSLMRQERTMAEEEARRAAFLDRTSLSLSESLDVEAVSRRAVDLVVPTLAEASIIQLVDGGTLRQTAFSHATAEGRALIEKAQRERSSFEGGAYLAKRVIDRRDSVLVPCISETTLSVIKVHPSDVLLVRALGIRSAIGAPLLVSGRAIGAITFWSRERQYGNADLQLAEDFAMRLAVALENARLHERVREAVRVRDEFISLAAHELHTPVAALQLAAQGLARRATSAPREDIARSAERMTGQIKRLNRLIDQMLDGSHIVAKRLSLARAPTDLAQVARDTVETFAPRLERAGCVLTLQADAPVVGSWDHARLEQMLSSLLDNALKFGAGKPIDVSVTADGANALLVVRDSGPGIPPDRLSAVFEPFERAVSAEHYGGLGLGLFIARAIAEAHGGDLSVDTHLGEGATFTARLPLRPGLDS